MDNNKFPKQYQKIYQQTKDNFKTEGYELAWIDEIYLPFWVCKQQVYVQTEIKPDQLSSILFQLVENGIKSHKKICEFLGVQENDFVLAQLDYLVTNEYLEENVHNDNSIYYEITFEGREFFDEKSAEQNIEEIEVDYVISEMEHITEEKYETFFNDLNQEFFDESAPLDSNAKHKFSGYKVIETHKLKKNNSFLPNVIKHGSQPTLNKIKNSNFVEFFNSKHEHHFYDFHDSKSIEAHRRSIKFYIIYFRCEDQPDKIEIRHCPETARKFNEKNPVLENKLTKSVEKYLHQDTNFIEKLIEYRQKTTHPKS